MLKGPKEYLAKMVQGTELPFTVLYFTCLFGTLYGALTSSYIYSVIFSAGQLGALSWYLPCVMSLCTTHSQNFDPFGRDFAYVS